MDKASGIAGDAATRTAVVDEKGVTLTPA